MRKSLTENQDTRGRKSARATGMPPFPVPARDLSGVDLTPFQWEVLQAALAIPFGETRSYAWIARRIGRPEAVRAVGQALRQNPFPLIVPCHRVVRSDGTPGGYAGADDGRKARLIELEKELRQQMRGSGRAKTASGRQRD